MKIKIVILFFMLICTPSVFGQNVKIEVSSPSMKVFKDSTIVTMKINVQATDIDSKKSILLTPILSSSNNSVELSPVILNGEKAYKSYLRAYKLNQRRGKNPSSFMVGQVYELNEEGNMVEYRGAVNTQNWMKYADLSIRKEILEKNGKKSQQEVFVVSSRQARNMNTQVLSTKREAATPMTVTTPTHTAVATPAPVTIATPTTPVTVTTPVSTRTNYTDPAPYRSENMLMYKGSYLSPESDATDERNQKELKFNLDEAMVMAEINPGILSLRELYTVAISYKNRKEDFYRIIDISVKIYPADPIANLNAASAAIERGNVEEAGRYLQIASRETLAYMNCKGTYELLCNNIYEGLRLLKAAKAAGSEEASYNLDLYFKSNRSR